MHKLLKYFTLLFVFFLFYCKKEKYPLGGSSSSNYSKVDFICDTLPPEPQFGWGDTTTNNTHNIVYWAYNPANNSEIIYLDNEGNLYAYNLQSKSRKFLDNGIMFIPSINKTNWVTYGKANFVIYKIKSNGDSLKQLISSIGGEQPKWDYTGDYIYYFQPSFGSNPSGVIKITKDGVKVDSTLASGSYQCFAKTSDNYVKKIGNGLYLIDPIASTQTLLCPAISFQNHICFDKNDKNLFWWNQYGGLVKLNLASKKIDTLVRFCENFMVVGLNVSPNSDKLTMGHYQLKQIGSWWKLYHKVDPIEYDLNTQTWRKLNIQF